MSGRLCRMQITWLDGHTEEVTLGPAESAADFETWYLRGRNGFPVLVLKHGGGRREVPVLALRGWELFYADSEPEDVPSRPTATSEAAERCPGDGCQGCRGCRRGRGVLGRLLLSEGAGTGVVHYADPVVTGLDGLGGPIKDAAWVARQQEAATRRYRDESEGMLPQDAESAARRSAYEDMMVRDEKVAARRQRDNDKARSELRKNRKSHTDPAG